MLDEVARMAALRPVPPFAHARHGLAPAAIRVLGRPRPPEAARRIEGVGAAIGRGGPLGAGPPAILSAASPWRYHMIAMAHIADIADPEETYATS